MLRRLGIRGKVLAALSVPVLVLFMLAGILSVQSLEDARTARTTQDLLPVLENSRQVAIDLRAERRASIMVAQDQDVIKAGGAADVIAAREAKMATDLQTVATTREAVTTAVSRMNLSLAGVDLTALDAEVAREVTRVQESLENLAAIRARIDSTDPPSMDVVQQSFSLTVDDVIAFPGRIGDVLSDRRLGRILNAQGLVASTQDHYSRELALGYEFIQATTGLPAAIPIDADMGLDVSSQFAASDVEHDRTTVSVAGLDLGDDVEMPRLGASARVTTSYQGFRASIQNLDTRLRYFQAADFETSANAEIDASNDLQNTLTSAARSRASTTANSATRTAVITIAVSLAAVIISIVTALAIARQIIRPLRRLTEAAGTVRDELPHLVEQVAIPGQGPDLRLTRIPVTSRDEIGRLAAAFNEVNQTTIEVAQEQAALRASIAEMFVNVARRDQVLLNRQLSFIDALERSEENPKILADLFRLDHLATRMRRNAESLLVLAGIDTGRRLREALPTSDVIRTASSEIEHYERIQLDLPVDPYMLGHTALPAAHMMAEILENATVFSDPGTPVHVSTGIDESAVIITIHDQGLGMLTEELAIANAKIATTSASDVLGSQRLGLYVVGRIAARLGSSVTLAKGPDDKGTLVTVRMPLVLFVDPQSIPLTPPTRHEVETFVPLEEAAAVVHDAAYAPAPSEGFQDVAAGAYGSAENPAQAVDIAALVEGTTDTGLPKRRSHGNEATTWDMSGGDEASASAIPLAPTAESLAGAAAAQPDEVWRPPVVQTTTPLVTRTPGATPSAAASGLPARATSVAGSNLPPRVPTGPAGSALPARTATGSQPPVPQSGIGGPTASGLPARHPSGVGGPNAVDAVSTDSATGPANVEGRTAMFAGFRSRRAEVQAAAISETGDETVIGSDDAVERLAVAATGAARFFRRDAGAAPTDDVAVVDEMADDETRIIIPSLVEDDDEFGDPAFAPSAPVQDIVAAAPAVPSEDEPWRPKWPAQAEREAFQPVAAVPAVPAAEPWQPQWQIPAVDDVRQPVAPAPEAPLWAPAAFAEPAEPVAPVTPVAETPRAAPAPGPWVGSQADFQPPAFAPQPFAPQPFEPQPFEVPALEAPVYQQPAFPPAAPVAQPPAFQPPAYEAPVAQPPAFRPPAYEAPVAQPPAFQPPAYEAPVAQPPAFQPPAFGAPSEPAAPAASTPYQGFGYAGPVDFAELVQGPTRRSMREPRRRGLFRRRKAAPATATGSLPIVPAASAASATPPVLSPPSAPTPAPFFVAPVPPAAAAPAAAFPAAPAPAAFEPAATDQPVRQSAWGAPTNGSHVVPEPFAEPAQPEFPTWQPPTSGAFEAAATAAMLEPQSEEAWAPTWGVPAAPTPAEPQPTPADGAWSPAWAAQPAAETWPTHATPDPIPAPAPLPPAAVAPAPVLPTRAPANSAVGLPSRGSIAPPAAPAAYSGQTSFTPQPMFGFDDEMTSMLAQRADIAQQALAELNQLSMYRPAVAAGSSSSLTRRTPGTIPAAPAIATSSSAPRPARDANQVRSLLSSFQSGTSRGRQLADGEGAPIDTGDNGLAGNEEGHGDSVTTPDTDLTTRGTTW